MSYEHLRRWLITASLFLTGSYFAVLIIAPATKYPLSFAQALQLIQVILPLFVGYLGSATFFVFQAERGEEHLPLPPNSLLSLIVKGPVLTASLLSLVLFFAFGISNWPQPGAATGNGMSFDVLSGALSIILSLHTATTSAAVSYLFHKEKSNEDAH